MGIPISHNIPYRYLSCLRVNLPWCTLKLLTKSLKETMSFKIHAVPPKQGQPGSPLTFEKAGYSFVSDVGSYRSLVTTSLDNYLTLVTIRLLYESSP